MSTTSKLSWDTAPSDRYDALTRLVSWRSRGEVERQYSIIEPNRKVFWKSMTREQAIESARKLEVGRGDFLVLPDLGYPHGAVIPQIVISRFLADPGSL